MSLLLKNTRKSVVVQFAQHHDLIYFHKVDPDGTEVPVIRGSTVSPGQHDQHCCIGTHAEYDMVLIQRTSKVESQPYTSKPTKWYVLPIDLKTAKNLPYTFIGTKQQDKAFYASILHSHRDARYLSIPTTSPHASAFTSRYAVLASPAVTQYVHELLSDDIVDSMAAHKYPFAIEIEQDSIIVITNAKKPNQQLLDKLLHFALWFAKMLDKKFN